jgi:Ser/Thr protein kinase RdoA (MazF antagonist)
LSAVKLAAGKQEIHVSAPLSMKENAQYLFEWNERHFYLMRYVEGERISFKNLNDVACVLGELATLHRYGREAGKFLSSKLNLPETISLLEPFEKYANLVEEAARMVNDFNGNTIASKLLKGPLDDALLQIKRSREIIAEAIEEGFDFQRTRTLCHGDSHENNYLMLNKNSKHSQESGQKCCYLLDIESFNAMSGVVDIVVPLHALGFYSRWSQDVLEQAIKAYIQKRRLSAGEWKYLLAKLMLPRLWFRSTHSLLKRNGQLHHMELWLKWYRRSRMLKYQRACVEKLIESELIK